MNPTDIIAPLHGDLPASDDWLMSLKTPCYVYDPSVVLARFAALRQRLATSLIVSLKANPNLDLLIRCGHAFVDGIELASQGELDLVAGRIHAPKYVNNPSMDEPFMRAALASRCIFIIDSLEQAQRLIQVVGQQPPPQTVLRLNACELVGMEAHLADHFGMSRHDVLLTAKALAHAHIPVMGLHVFAGSHHFRLDNSGADAADLAHALAAFAPKVAHVTGKPITFLNLGGGFTEHSDSQEATFDTYRQRLASLLPSFTLAHESGRAIFASAGTFVTRIRAVKVLGERYVAICDGGLSHNFLLARTESLLKKYAQPRLLRQRKASADDQQRPIQFVGSTCSRADVIGWQHQACAAPDAGDLVIFENCGAYHQSYSVSGFLSHKPAHSYIHQS
ncbi:PLP-dependent decarboxylase [Pseudomonas chlororaphis]|jgi:diaminopimelate decarboxylase|uniref:PLP-dependent decarboxylase n=1 Tax=Pseudomonas chlororaphis TaxID=587753 RepID=UPI0015DF224C|nr:PLP-dependent decarboxylase [Pseudomonas chlororaphis]QLL12561.1 PLP-dependent decarboxylase [Pseudomonas chlororaphis subsp. aurantiaca]